jgi:hypothetical protein
MAAPAQRAVSGARRERNSNKHKRLFLPGEPGGLTVGTDFLDMFPIRLQQSCVAQAGGHGPS